MRPALAVALVALLAPSARAQRWAGLECVALRPDGKQLAAGGQSRVVFFLDPGELAVRSRYWHGARIASLSYNRDGSRLVITDDADALSFFDVAGGTVLARVSGVRFPSPAPAADLVAVRSLRGVAGTTVRLLSLTDGTEKGLMELKERVAAFSLSADGKRLLVLTASQPGDEKRVPVEDIPRDLVGLPRLEFQLRHDGQVATLRTLEVPSGKLLREAKLWYTSDSDSTRLLEDGTDTLVVNYPGPCARIAADGGTTLFETGLLFNHALAGSADGKLLAAGGLRAGTVGAPGGKRVRFTLDVLPGADEYVAGFAVRADGSLFGVTTAFRAFRVSREGKMEKLVPVY